MPKIKQKIYTNFFSVKILKSPLLRENTTLPTLLKREFLRQR